jgi:hypothetical protein
MPSDQEIEAAAEALWLDASHDRFGPFSSVEEKVKKLWRKSAIAALQAAERVRQGAAEWSAGMGATEAASKRHIGGKGGR